MKKRIFLSLALVVVLLLGLSGCRKAPKAIGLIINEPESVVGTSFIDKGLQVFRVYEGGNVVEVKKGANDGYAYTISSANSASEKNAGVYIVTVEDRGAKDPNNKNENLKAQFKIIITTNTTVAIDPQDSFLSYRFTVQKDGELIKSTPFTHQIGYSFKYNEIQDLMTIYKITANEAQTTTVAVDITEDVAEELRVNDEKEFIKYKQENYTVNFTIDGIEGKFEVLAVGGEKPLHSKSANWFDYILVIPVGWLMQLFSFGGIFGLGIFFTTIIVRTLAWPVYAKTNAMSANMTEAQPELQRIQAKYRGRTDKDSQRLMQMETMQVYKKYKIGMSSMLLPFLQMPIFIAMYNAVRRILIPGGFWADKISVRTFLGIDLTIGNHWTSYILAGLVGASMFLLQWLSMRKPKGEKQTAEHNKNPQANQQAKTMKIVSYVMVIMMVIFSLQNNALALYWVFGNLFSVGQTLLHKELNKRKKEQKNKDTLGGIL